MSDNVFLPGSAPNTVRTKEGQELKVPSGWILLEPGDAALTRRTKVAGPHWVIQENKGRKTFSRGLFAEGATIERIRKELEEERATEGYTKRKAADAKRREKVQNEYVEDFLGAVVSFLDFDPRHQSIGHSLAQAVADHATPVGSGTVARTKRIPIEKRAEAAVIAWMRHQTTAYDSMKIPRIQGKRREVRRMLAQRSNELLSYYRRGEQLSEHCPLLRALNKGAKSKIDGPKEPADN